MQWWQPGHSLTIYKHEKLATMPSRTFLLQKLKRAFALASQLNKTNKTFDQVEEELYNSRRKFLKQSAMACTAIVAGSLLPSCKKENYFIKDDVSTRSGNFLSQKYKIAVIGAGIAGLNCAYQLKKAGFHADIYEANTRTGGRILTAHDLMAPGLYTELGAEFIDSTHADMIALCSEFNLGLLDTQSPKELQFTDAIYFFDGIPYSEKQLVQAFQPYVAQMDADINSLPANITYQNPGNAADFEIPLTQYLDNLGMTGAIRQMIDVGYVSEFGLENDHQSALNLLTDFNPNKQHYVDWYGNSDERYKVKGGNSLVTDKLTSILSKQIHYYYRLESAAPRGQGFTLSFLVNGSAQQVNADFLVFALPFSLLREVDLLSLALPDVKKECIKNLGYGKNAKLFAGMKKRVWRRQNQSGFLMSNTLVQNGWDNSRVQPGTQGGYTIFVGGKAGIDLANGTPHDQLNSRINVLETAFPGFAANLNGNVSRYLWPTAEFSKGSYACYKTGQFVKFIGSQFFPVGNLFFCGEHTSINFQGYMNGGAATGRKVAELLLNNLGK